MTTCFFYKNNNNRNNNNHNNNTGSAVLEVEECALAAAQETWTELKAVLTSFDFVQNGMVQLRPFRSGSVAT